MAMSDIGLVGLAVMGENLALNMESKGFKVSVYNRPHPNVSAVGNFLAGRGKSKNFEGFEDLKAFVNSLSSPRKVFLMIKAGAAVDEMIKQLLPLLNRDDIIIDGGNSDFHDSERRFEELSAKHIRFVATGVSGGEEGALKGPSIMPGGDIHAWDDVKKILQAIAAKIEDGSPCCEWMGSGGAGHFVKMVHNGIEYGDMQLISEAYQILKLGCGLSNEEIAEIFTKWNKGELSSYLIEITAQIFKYKDKDGSYLLDNILDIAGQKGTGKWSVMAALDDNNPLTLIASSVFARFLSANKNQRQKASEVFDSKTQRFDCEKTEKIEALKDALFASKIISYAQGFALLSSASKFYDWDLDFAAIAKIWRNGCIIRADFLTKISEAYEENEDLENLIFDDFFAEKIKSALSSWRSLLASTTLAGIPTPCMTSALSYFDSIRQNTSGANLIQAQRDYFGAHTYERTDAPRGEFFHTDWANTGGKTSSGSYNA